MDLYHEFLEKTKDGSWTQIPKFLHSIDFLTEKELAYLAKAVPGKCFYAGWRGAGNNRTAGTPLLCWVTQPIRHASLAVIRTNIRWTW